MGEIVRKEIVSIRLNVLDENGHKKKYVTITDVVNDIVKAYNMQLSGLVSNGKGDGYNYRANLYKLVERALIGKDKEEQAKRIEKGQVVKDGRKCKIDTNFALEVINTNEFLEKIYKFGSTERARKTRLEKIRKLGVKAESHNESYWNYKKSGQCLDDEDIETAPTGLQEAIDGEIKDRKKDIITRYTIEKLIDSLELKVKLKKADDGAIDDAIREKKFEIVLDYIAKNYIEIDDELLEHDVTLAYIAGLIPGDLNSIDEAAIERLEDISNYYKERNNRRK